MPRFFNDHRHHQWKRHRTVVESNWVFSLNRMDTSMLSTQWWWRPFLASRKKWSCLGYKYFGYFFLFVQVIFCLFEIGKHFSRSKYLTKYTQYDDNKRTEMIINSAKSRKVAVSPFKSQSHEQWTVSLIAHLPVNRFEMTSKCAANPKNPYCLVCLL